MTKTLVTYLSILLFILSASVAYTQPYMTADAQFYITEYKILSYIDKVNSTGYDPNIPLFIDPNFTIPAEPDGALKFDLSGLEENIIYYLRIFACYNGTCNTNPVYVVMHRKPLPPEPLNVVFDGSYLKADPQDGVNSYKIISHIDPNNSPSYVEGMELFLDPNITTPSNSDGSLNYDLTGLEPGITYSLQIFCCMNDLCGYPVYTSIYKDPVDIPKPLNVSVTKEGLYGRNFYFMVIQY